MSGSQFWRRTSVVIAAAAVVNVAVYLIAGAAGVEILVPQGASPTSLGLAPVIVFTAVPLALAAVLMLVLRRFGVSSPRVFAGVVVVGTVLSLLAPMTADLTLSNKLTLAAMHVVAGLAALVGLTPMYRTGDVDARVAAVTHV